MSPDPDVRCVTLTRHDTFMVLACDGLWNALPEQQVRRGSHRVLVICAKQCIQQTVFVGTRHGTACDGLRNALLEQQVHVRYTARIV